MTTIDDRVAAGAAWLDANRPGWWQRINLATLDLTLGCGCILGQLDGNFYDAPEVIQASTIHALKEFAAPLGFLADTDNEERLSEWEEYAALTAAWRTLIQARRNAEDPWAHWADEPDADPAPAAWPDRTHDGQRMRDTETANVHGRVL
jgi:hypothetical protein